MNATFKLVDQVSSVLNNIGTNGKRVIAGMEDDFVRVNSHITQTSRTTAQASASLSKLSGDISGAAAQSRLLANAMADEAEKMHKAAQNAQLKADTTERMAEMARRHYNEILKDIEAETKSENASKKSIEAMKEKASAALLETERLEKASAALRKKAEAADKAADAAQDNAQAALQSAQAEEKLHTSATKTASAEKQVAEALNRSEQQAEEYAFAARKAANESDKLGSQGESTAQLLEGAFTALAVERVLVGIKNAFVECSKAAIEYESAITGVYKTVNGTETELSAISDDIKQMALDIPSTTTEIASVAESAGQLGIGTKYITDFTEVMINLDETTNMASNEAASSLAKFSNITKMSETNYENLGSTVVALGNNFATTEADIVAMATRMASAGTLAGLTESEILGLSAAVSSVGIEAEAGGSAMSTLLSEIQVAVETGNDSLDDFASVANMTAEEFQTAFKDNAANALYSFIDGLNDVERNGATATVILENMGITEIRLSNAVKALASNSEGLSGAIKLAGDAWNENTALATEAELRYGTLESRLNITKNAANNLKIAIGDVLNPVVADFADAGTGALVWLTEFTENNPAVIAAITAGAVAIGTAALAVGGFTFAVNVAKPAVEKLTAAMSKNPIFLGITVATSVITAISTFAMVLEANQESIEDYNGTLSQCRTEIENTEIAYKNVCNMYGENSQAAQSLAAELDTLNAQYEKGGGFIADYEQRLAESKEALDSFTVEYNDKMDEIDKDWQSGLIATAQLEALSDKAQLTNADLDMMSNYADYLNNTFNCDIKVNYDTGELTGFNPKNVTDILIKESEEKRKQTAANSITDSDFTNDYINEYREYKKNKNIFKTWEEELNKIASDPSYISPIKVDYQEYLELEEKLKKGKDLISDYEQQVYNAFTVMENPEGADKFIQDLENTALGFDEVKNSAEDVIEVLTSEKAVSDVWSRKQEEISKLAEAYDEAYSSIRADLDGLFGLFEEASMNLEDTVSLDSAIGNLESQIDYFEQYKTALDELSNLGVNNDILKQLDPGQAVAFAQELGNMNIEAAKTKVDELNKTFDGLSEAKDKTAEIMTDIEKEFSEKLNDIKSDLEKAIDDMSLESEAAASAKLTMSGYIAELKKSGNSAVLEAESISSRISSALNGGIRSSVSNTAVAISGAIANIKGYASGTSYAEAGLKLVGEEGPELVMLQGGERIFNAAETARMLNNHSDGFLNVSLPESPVKAFKNNSENTSEHKFSIDINGKGAIDVKGGMNKEEVVEILFDYLKPVLMNILSQEIFEEGDNSYEI
ncbi:MAG: phage tail tape measure protein [Ruminococcus sp.]|nr:phage tail tape measure protein [Ruminococcus sp.]